MHASVRCLLAGTAVAALASCTDSATSPRTAATRTPSPSAPVFDFSATTYSLGFTQSDFSVSSSGGSFSIGVLYTVSFPANSVCDPARSTYGAGEWDNDCVLLDQGQSVKIHATLVLSSNGLSVDFTPGLRFAPTANVMISTDVFAPLIKANRDYFSKNPSALNSLAILYSSNLGDVGVSDYARDKSVATHVNLSTGRIWRRVKHFSGYSIISGEACDPSPDNPDCVWVDDKQ